MPKILQVNVTANWGSTGKIAEQIGLLVMSQGWESYIAYGRYANVSGNKLIKVGSKLSIYEHYLENRFLDNEGLASRIATLTLIKQIQHLAPDIVHLHNIHDHWINYNLLFQYLNSIDIPIVWTHHDCWAFTGGCAHYSLKGCYKWQYECSNCNFKRSCIDRSHRNFYYKRNLFLANNNLTHVAVSQWLKNEIDKSYFKTQRVEQIYNGIDTDQFVIKNGDLIKQKYGISTKFILLGVANCWSEQKGYSDYLALSKLLPNDCVIVLVGLQSKRIKGLPKNIIGISRTNNVNELIDLYAMADVVLNLSYQETFGLTTAEGLACGTPGIVYNCTASPELITKDTGRIVEKGNIEEVLRAIYEIKLIGKANMSNACRQRVLSKFDKNKSYKRYLDLYNSLLEEHRNKAKY